MIATDPNDGALGGNVKGGDPETYSPTVWSWLIYRFNLKSVLDVGCGEGHAMRWFGSDGLRVSGFDGLKANVDNAVVSIILHDLRRGPFITTGVDLVWCCEVVEHLEEQYVNNLITTLNNGRVIAMTHALPDQGGYHHVNCRPAEYWIEKLCRSGRSWLEPETVEMRKVAMEACQKGEGGRYLAQSGLLFS